MPPPDVLPSTLNRQFSENCPVVLGKGKRLTLPDEPLELVG